MTRERGFTLVELMAAMAVLAIAALALGGLLEGIRQDDRLSAAYVRDVDGMRRALRAVERDLRSARTVKELSYRLERGRLLRDGHELATNVAVFQLTQRDGLATARIALGSRQTGRRTAVVTTTVRLREDSR